MKLNSNIRLGNVLFIVEGSKSEFVILRKIFCNLLHFTYIEKRRTAVHHFIKQNDEYSKIAVINTRESNVTDITEKQDYLDSVFQYLIDKCSFPVDDCAIYYLFDRDPDSNTNIDLIKEYIRELKNPYENENYKAGQLLLSYPSIESYIVSCFKNDVFLINETLPNDEKIRIGSELKTYIGKNKEIQLNKINSESLLHATNEFIKYLRNEKINFNIDDFSFASMDIFNRQESRYSSNKFYLLFSMLTLAFLQLNIIEVDGINNDF